MKKINIVLNILALASFNFVQSYKIKFYNLSDIDVYAQNKTSPCTTHTIGGKAYGKPDDKGNPQPQETPDIGGCVGYFKIFNGQGKEIGSKYINAVTDHTVILLKDLCNGSYQVDSMT